MFKQVKSILVAGGIAFSLATQASATVIFFDGFESPGVNSWQVFQNNVGDNGDWQSISGTGIEIQNSVVTAAYEGTQYIELDSDDSNGGLTTPGLSTNSAMVAQVPFIVGDLYEISFAYRPRTNDANDNVIELFDASVSGSVATLGNLLASANNTLSNAGGWSLITVLYQATQSANGIAFGAAGTANTLGGFIDAVSVTNVSEVPLPAALPLFGMGLAGMQLVRRRKSKTA